MLKNEDIICISSIDWDFIWQGHQEIMTRLARNGNRVLFIENTGVRVPSVKDIGRLKSRLANWRKGLHGIRKIEEGLYVYSPLVLPFPYLRLARFINKKLIFSVLFRWLKAVGFSEPIVWNFLPTGLSLDLINEIDPKVLVYYCIDSFQASSKDARKVKATEKLVLKKSDLVFVTAGELFRYCEQWNGNVHYFPFGVNIEHFKDIFDKDTPQPDDIKDIKRPIVGYIGGVHKWIDFDLVRYAADKERDVSFVFCGPIQADISLIKGLPNVILLGQKSQKDLPLYVKEFDAAIIPYRITEYTKNVYPTKLNEYLAMGKRVISTDLPEVKRFNDEFGGIVDIASDQARFLSLIKDALEARADGGEISLARQVAEKNSWKNRLEEMSSLIEKVESEKMKEKETFWNNNLKLLYNNTMKKLLSAAALLVLAYLLVFHTPLIWLAGRPLYVKDVPEKSDVIVALGAGVGESGRAGQNYEERVDTAVRLYKKGLAGKIVYSSGYRYVMQEAQVMKALSVSMGVKPDDIILDDTSIHSYDMISHLRDNMQRHGWKSAIVVSSPYHMLRVSLLCDKYLKEYAVFCYPVEDNSYYYRSGGVKIRHIMGILHEYAAILYYKIKGYI